MYVFLALAGEMLSKGSWSSLEGGSRLGITAP